jgi:PAN domain
MVLYVEYADPVGPTSADATAGAQVSSAAADGDASINGAVSSMERAVSSNATTLTPAASSNQSGLSARGLSENSAGSKEPSNIVTAEQNSQNPLQLGGSQLGGSHETQDALCLRNESHYKLAERMRDGLVKIILQYAYFAYFDADLIPVIGEIFGDCLVSADNLTDAKMQKQDRIMVMVTFRRQSRRVYDSDKIPTLRHLSKLSEVSFADDLYGRDIVGFSNLLTSESDEEKSLVTDDVQLASLVEKSDVIGEVKILMLHLNVEFTRGMTPLIKSLLERREDDAHVLLAAGADPEKKIRATANDLGRGCSAIHAAASCGFGKFVRVLVEKHDVKLTAADFAGRTVMHYADLGQLYLAAEFMVWMADCVRENPRILSEKHLSKCRMYSDEEFATALSEINTETGRRLLAMTRVTGVDRQLPRDSKVLNIANQQTALLLTPVGADARPNLEIRILYDNGKTDTAPQRFLVAYPSSRKPYTTSTSPSNDLGKMLFICVLFLLLLLFCPPMPESTEPQAATIPQTQPRCFISFDHCRPLNITARRDFSSQRWPYEIKIENHLVHNLGVVRRSKYEEYQSESWNYESLSHPECMAAARIFYERCKHNIHDLTVAQFFDPLHDGISMIAVPSRVPWTEVLHSVGGYSDVFAYSSLLNTALPFDVMLEQTDGPDATNSSFAKQLRRLGLPANVSDALHLWLASIAPPKNRKCHLSEKNIVLVKDIPPLQSEFALFHGYDLPTADLHNHEIKTDSIQQCAATCKYRYKCDAFAFVKASGACWLKAVNLSRDSILHHRNLIHNPNVTFGVRKL